MAHDAHENVDGSLRCDCGEEFDALDAWRKHAPQGAYLWKMPEPAFDRHGNVRSPYPVVSIALRQRQPLRNRQWMIENAKTFTDAD